MTTIALAVAALACLVAYAVVRVDRELDVTAGEE